MRAAEAGDIHFQFFADIPEFRRAAVAVSGGSDSMALLHLATVWARQHGAQIVALTVDHGLRPGSVTEARQVAVWANALGVEHVTLRWEGDKPKSGLQAKARQKRYELLTAWCRENFCPVLMTGHTMNDQAETVAMRARRTRSVHSLAGIWPKLQFDGVDVYRPLLTATREELRDLLKLRGQQWIDDPSNDDEIFERVRVRKTMLAGDIAELASKARQSVQLSKSVRARVQEWLSQYAVVHDAGYVELVRGRFTGLDIHVAELVIQSVLGAVVGKIAESRNILAMHDWLLRGEGSRRTLGGAIFQQRRATILVMREAGRIREQVVSMPASGRVIWDRRFEVVGPVGLEVLSAQCLDAKFRIPGVPRAAFDALPAVRFGDGAACLAFGSENSDVNAKFIKKFTTFLIL